MTGTHWVNDAGYFQGPILITNTHGIGARHHGAAEWMMRTYQSYFRTEFAWAMPVVAETYDGVLNDTTTLHVKPEHAVAALDAARGGPVAEGSIGGGNGMIAYGFKGGSGTSSRRIEIGGQAFTVAALVQANFGIRDWFTVLGVPVGKATPLMRPFRRPEMETGSIIVILATDAPLSDALLRGVAKRAGLGIGRSGTAGGNSSGDIFLAFSTADPMDDPASLGPVITRHSLNWEKMDLVYEAAVQAVDESVINAIVLGDDLPCVRPEGEVCPGIDMAELCRIVLSQTGAR